MMNKFVSKTIKKGGIFGGIIAGIIVLAVILCSIFGVNYATELEDAKTLTVQMNTFFYNNKVEELETICEEEFDASGLKVAYQYNGEMAGDTCEIVYVFANAKDVETKLAQAKTNIATTIQTKTAENGDWYGYTMQVTTGSEDVKTEIPTSYTVSGVIVAVALCVVVGVYVAIRYGLYKGILTAVATLVSMVFTASVILLTRIPVTTGVFYAVALGGLISATFTTLTLAKLRGADENLKGEALVVSSVPCKEIGTFAIVLGVAIFLVGAIATWSVRYVALCAIIALDLAVYVALHIVPAVLLVLQNKTEKEEAETNVSGYVGAKKADNEE